MKKLIKWLIVLLTAVFVMALTACDFLPSGPGSQKSEKEYNDELDASSGKWTLLDEKKERTDTYFEFDGRKNQMTFKYVEDGEEKYTGTYRCIYKENNGENTFTLNFILSRNGETREDWIYTYADDFETHFSQFTTIRKERSDDKNDGRIYSHIYRISELPYRLGTYLLEGKTYKTEKNDYAYAARYQVPEGTYRLDENTSITFVMPKPHSYALFQYRNEEHVVEGVYWTADDKKTIYLYIEHDPFEYIRREDRKDYDMTFSHDYPPDFYLRGNFEPVDGSISIDSLYHHEKSQTKTEDSVFKFGTYKKTA